MARLNLNDNDLTHVSEEMMATAVLTVTMNHDGVYAAVGVNVEFVCGSTAREWARYLRKIRPMPWDEPAEPEIVDVVGLDYVDECYVDVDDDGNEEPVEVVAGSEEWEALEREVLSYLNGRDAAKRLDDELQEWFVTECQQQDGF
jgi:hypothetical protein